MHASPDLQLYLLGPPQIKQGEQSLVIPRLQTRALFYRLAVHLQPVSREQLLFLFWPDLPDSRARRNLTQLLNHLRRALPTPDLLVKSADHVQLDTERVWCDSALLQRLCTGHETRLRFDDLLSAMTLDGGPLLSGFVAPADCPEYDLWLGNERRLFENYCLDALTALIDGCMARGKTEDAIRFARRYLKIDELAEEMHRQLMRLYAVTGERDAARWQFESCAAILERELGVGPLPETYALYQAILDGQIETLPHAGQEPVWATLAGPRVPLVGRAGALQSIRHVYEAAADGHGSVILLAGEAGIGKSRLMQEFATSLPSQVSVSMGASHPGIQSIPYQPIVEALRPAIQDAAKLSAVTPSWLSVASLLFPEIRNHYPHLPAPVLVEPEQARGQIFEALCQLLRAWSHPSLLLLCLDDLHWADSTTLDWLSYLARSLRHSRLLILGTYRSEEAASLSLLRDQLSRHQLLSEIQLVPLQDAEVQQVLTYVYRERAGTDALAARLQKITGGNPFFLLESVQMLLEGGTVPAHLDADADLPISPNVRAMIERRMEQLQPMARQLLEAGAVLGPAFDFDIVRQTAGRREMETVEGLDELLMRRFLEEHGKRYQFRHELIQAVVYRTLSVGRRQLLHRRVAGVLEPLHPNPRDPVSGQIAAHYARGGLPERAILFYQRAADVAARVSATQEAVQYLTTALELLQSLPDRTQQRSRELELRIALGSALTVLKGWSAPEIKEVYTQALILCDEVGEVSQRVQVIWGLLSHYIVQAQFAQVRALNEELLELVQDGEQRALLPYAYFHLGAVSLHQAEFVQAQPHFERCVMLYDPKEHLPYMFNIRPDYGMLSRCFSAHALWHLGYLDQALVQSQRALAEAEALSNPFDKVVALTYAATFHQFCHQIEAVQQLAQEAVALAEEHEFAYYLAWANILLGWVRVQREARVREARVGGAGGRGYHGEGEIAVGIGQMRRGLADFDKTAAGLRKPYYLGLLASSLATAGDVGEGLALLAEALALSSVRGEQWPEAELVRLQGELLLAQGNAEKEAEQHFDRAIVLARHQQAKSLELRAAMSLCRLWQKQGRQAQAERLLSPIYAWFTEGLDTPDLVRARAFLQALSL